MRSKFALFIIIVSYALHTNAQHNIGNIKNYTTDNGLPQNSVKDIEFDKNGYCWLATEVGIARFDGANFRLFNPNEGNPLRSSFFITNRKNDLYAHFDFPYMYDLAIDNANNVKFIRDKNYQFEYSRLGYSFNKSWMLNCIKSHKIHQHELESGRYTIGLDDEKAYLFSGNNLYFFNKNSKEIITLGENLNLSLFSLVGNNLIVKINNSYTIINENKIVAQNINLTGDIAKEKPDGSNENKIYWCQNGTFIFKNKKLFRLTVQNNQLIGKLLFENLPFSSMETINFNPIIGKYYIGTSTKGLFEITTSKFHISKLENKTEDDNVFYAQALIGDKIFANGHLFDKNGTSINTHIDHYKYNVLSLDGNILYYSQNKDNSILGIYDFKNKTNKYISTNVYENITSLAPNPFDSSILVATDYSVIKFADNKMTLITHVPDNQIRTLTAINKDTLLIAKRKGIYLYSISKNKYSTLVAEGEFRTIFKDKNENYWLGTYDTGYYIWNKKGLVKLPLDQGLRLKSVHSFHLDKNELMWMTTNNGLMAANYHELLAYKPKSNTNIFYRIFDKSDGLLNNEFNGGCDPALLVLPNGDVSYPSMEGLVRFSPDKITFSKTPEKIYLDKISSNNVPLEAGKPLIFDQNTKQVAFELSSPFFGKKDELIYTYKLGEKSETWLLAQENKIEFNELSYGNHTLYVKIQGNEKSIKAIPFRIKPHFYQTAWFYGLLFLGFLIKLYIFINYRTRLEKSKRIKLEKIVAEKTFELQNTIFERDQSVMQLENSESELSSLVVVQNKILNLVLHDLKSPLLFLNLLANDAVEQLKDNNPVATKKSVKSLSRGINEIVNFTNSFFEWIYFQRKGLKPVIEKIELKQVFSEIELLFKSMASQNSFSFSTENFSLKSDKNILITILRNILDNANKNTKNGHIKMKGLLREGNVIIYICDDGHGMPTEKIEEINQVFKNYKKAEKLEGFGYKIIIELLHLIQGDLEIKNMEKGTLITLTIPQDIFKTVPELSYVH